MIVTIRGILAAVILLTLAPSFCFAVSPQSIRVGQMLFQREWPSGNPKLGSDGLGPLFNGASCMTCHNQGGIGGGGAAEFNAKTVGIEELHIAGGSVSEDALRTLVQSFHPGFLLPGGTLINTCSITHHGGSPAYRSARSALIDSLPADFSDHGGPVGAADVRRANAYPIQYQNTRGNLSIKINARLFQRNTTALFGAGLLDQVPDKLIRAQMVAQRSHPEISGRPSTLRNGSYGKFGWRGNLATLVEFTDQACANEVGLRTNRRDQPGDPMAPAYRNPTIDITDQQVIAMRDFIAALPAPVRRIPEDSLQRILAERGEPLFASIGCAVCHVPDLGPARGAYTDLLLHEMGSGMMDLNHAEPYISRVTPVSNIRARLVSQNVSGTMVSSQDSIPMTGAYYGPSTVVTTMAEGGPRDVSLSRRSSPSSESGSARKQVRSGNAGGRRGTRPHGYYFRSPQYPSRTLVTLDRPDEDLGEMTFQGQSTSVAIDLEESGEILGRRNGVGINGSFETESTVSLTRENHLRVHFEPTRFNEEWRTPPLWGVADSAPYMHDGRAETLLEAITMHGGEAEQTRDRFLLLEKNDRDAVIAFLETLVAPPLE